MGSDYRHPVAEVDYREDSSADSTVQEQLEALNFQHATPFGPVDAVWSDRQDLL